MVKFRKFDKKFWATTFTLTGTILGAGILGLPYAFSKSGIMIGMFWLLAIGAIVIFTSLCLGEVALRTKGRHQMPGYAGKYLGKNSERIMLFAVVFGIYSALIAYLIGEGESLSQLITGSQNNAVFYAIGFWFVMTFLLREGLKELKKIETWGVLAIIIIVLGITAWFAPNIIPENYNHNNLNNFFLPFGIVLFAMLGFTSIPELREEIKGEEKKFKKAIILGNLIPVVLYILFTLVFVGVLGKGVPEVATLAFGKPITLLGIFTMLTSFFVLSFCLKDIFEYDLRFSKLRSFILVSILPLVLYLILTYYHLSGFVEILGIGGAISGGIGAIMILLVTKKAKRNKTRNPEFQVRLPWWLLVLIVLFFLMGILTEVLPLIL